MNFLQMIYAKTTLNTKGPSESVPYERLRKASTQFHLHTINYSECKKSEGFLRQVQHFLNEMVLSLEEEIRFSRDKKCFCFLVTSGILEDMVGLCRNDRPTGILGMTLLFFQQVIEVTNNYSRENDGLDILQNDAFIQPLLRLLETSKQFYNCYDEYFISLSCIICKIVTELVESNPFVIDIFIGEDFSCPLADSLIKCLHLTSAQKGMDGRNGILNFLKSACSKKAAKYIFKHSDLALLSSISLGAHFSQLKNSINISHASGEAFCATQSKSQNLKLHKEICAFLSTVNFCQDMMQVVQESNKNPSCEYKEFKKMFDNYLTDHIRTYFLKNILKTYIAESSEFNISALMYYCSWIIRIVHVSPLKELFLDFFFSEACNTSKKSGYLWRNFSLSSFFPAGAQSSTNLAGDLAIEMNQSRESLSSMVFSVHPKLSIPTFLIAQLGSTKQDCLLTCYKMFSNLFCYHPDYAIRELLIGESPFYYSNEGSQLIFYQGIGQFLSLINSAGSGALMATRFHRLQMEICEKIKSKTAILERTCYQETSNDKMIEQINQFKTNYFFSALLNAISCYWKNSFAVNVALLEFLHEILTCPVPVIYGAFCSNFSLEDSSDEKSFFNCILEIAFKNDFVLNHLSDSGTVELIHKVRHCQESETFKSEDKLLFAQNYFLLEEFIKEIVAILQAHALNFYGCVSFEDHLR